MLGIWTTWTCFWLKAGRKHANIHKQLWKLTFKRKLKNSILPFFSEKASLDIYLHLFIGRSVQLPGSMKSMVILGVQHPPSDPSFPVPTIIKQHLGNTVKHVFHLKYSCSLITNRAKNVIQLLQNKWVDLKKKKKSTQDLQAVRKTN